MVSPRILPAIIITDTYDGDNDYIPDTLELVLAEHFCPKLHIWNDDLQYFYPWNYHDLPFSADPYVNTAGSTLYITLSYGMIFTEDTGAFPHTGDPEFCQVLIKVKSSYSIQDALIDSDAWEIISRKSFAHVGTPCEHIYTEPTYSIPPEFWVSQKKHGFFTFKALCDASNCDECSGTYVEVGGLVGDLQNIGSYAFTRSPYIERHIWDNSQSGGCWVNIWDGVDFPEASSLMGPKKFTSFPSFYPWDIYEIYQPGGTHNHSSDNISTPYPNPVRTDMLQASNLTINYRDAYLSFDILCLTGAKLRDPAVGRTNPGSYPIRVWDTLFRPPSQSCYFVTGYIQSRHNYIRQTSTRKVTYLSNTPSYPDVSSVEALSSTLVRIDFTEPVNLTQNSVHIRDDWYEDDIFLGTLSPVVTMFGNSYHSTYYFTTDRPLTSLRYRVWIAKQDVVASDRIVVPYMIRPYFKELFWFWGKSSSTIILALNSGVAGDNVSWAQFELTKSGWADVWVEGESGFKEQLKSSNTYYVPAGKRQLVYYKARQEQKDTNFKFRIRVQKDDKQEEMIISPFPAKAERQTITPSLSSAVSLPKSFSLSQNYPNPFNPSTTIYFEIPEGHFPDVSLNIYDLRGRIVKQLIKSSPKYSGRYYVYWDGHDEKGNPVSSGVYFYRLIADDFSETKKMVLLK